MFYRYQDSPIGRLFMVGDDAGLQQLLMDVERTPWRIGDDWRAAGSQLDDVSRQLDEYFSGRRQRFGLRLNPQGTAFQQSVWRALQDIPFGRIDSYSALAQRIDRPKAVRAVGAANGANPICIIIPCHRVIGRDGSLTGFAGGLPRKQLLLELEGAVPRPQASLFD
ncbi:MULTISPECIES: methylated-DNA--[protein]-cysteine S-methyltransferase [Pseudomonas]|uniref:Methylated-DNA--protein-cysteine methyltransferase n=2 Tax=Pseudomonadaceae TaxID=135621 RepID=A0A0D0KLB4_9PSED|nr:MULTISPECIES: methylated-DNA--[protein]-cysteine S-methyltransferase [Pseudomonas]KIQ00187.1 cysteine methyltransferase [Pseudomonas fulva]MCW2292249.1 methylated-DNA-[protein]-cysteine S-methyltransferase [Pseudomonas sp. BIGb0408]NYH73179.1 methylated-DNA-[protein]-cysteine S-methyltransferase [Pseudomonas flavescens]